MAFSVQDFSPAVFPCLSYLNLRGNPLDENSAPDLLKLLREFSSLQALEVLSLNLADLYMKACNNFGT